MRMRTWQVVRQGAHTRQLEIGGEIVQGNQDECAPVHLRMGDLQTRTVNLLLAEQEQVEIQRAWTPVLTTLTPIAFFDSLQLVEQRVRIQRGVEHGNGIDIIRLAREAQRRRAIQRRVPDQLGVGKIVQLAKGEAQLACRPIQIAAQSDKDRHTLSTHPSPAAAGLRRLRRPPLRERRPAAPASVGGGASALPSWKSVHQAASSGSASPDSARSNMKS